MKKLDLNGIISAGVADRAVFDVHLKKIILDYQENQENPNPADLLDRINQRLAELGDENFDNLSITVLDEIDDPSTLFDNTKRKLGFSRAREDRLELERMKFEVLAAMFSFVVTHPLSPQREAMISAIGAHGSQKDRAELQSLGLNVPTNFVDTVQETFVKFFYGSKSLSNAERIRNRFLVRQEHKSLLSGTPQKANTLQEAFEPFSNPHGYRLELNPPKKHPERGVIYLEKVSNTSVKYSLLDPQGIKQEGVVTLKQFVGDGTESEKDLRERGLMEILRKELEIGPCQTEILAGILNVAIAAGHAHIDFSFISSIENEDLKKLFAKAKEIDFDNLERINNSEKLHKTRHSELPKLAGDLEILTEFIKKMRRILSVNGNVMSSGQKTAIYRQLDILNIASMEAQDKIVDAMIERLSLLDPVELNNIDPLDLEKLHFCDEKRIIEKGSKYLNMKEVLLDLGHITNSDILKYLAYINKYGTDAQRVELYKLLPDKVKDSKEVMRSWLESKIIEWKTKLLPGEINFLLSFITTNKTIFQSSNDKKSKMITITQIDFLFLIQLVRMLGSFKNRGAMNRAIEEAYKSEAFMTHDNFIEFMNNHSAVTAQGTQLFNKLYPHLKSEDSVLGLMTMIQSVKDDQIRINIINKMIDRFGAEKIFEELADIFTLTDRTKGSDFAAMPASFLEILLEASEDYDGFLETIQNVNNMLEAIPLIATIGDTLTLNEIQKLFSVEIHDDDTLENALENLKENLNEEMLNSAGKMFKEMRIKGLIKPYNKEEISTAVQYVIKIVSTTMNIIQSLPNYPENEEELKNGFESLLVHLKSFKEKYGDEPHIRGILHHALTNLCSDSMLRELSTPNLDQEENPYQRGELKLFLKALRELEGYSEAEISLQDTSVDTILQLEIDTKKHPEFSSDRQNSRLIKKAFDTADAHAAYLRGLKEEEKELEKLLAEVGKLLEEHSESTENIPQQPEGRITSEQQKTDLQRAAEKTEQLVGLATGTHTNSLAAIKNIQSINKLTLGTRFKISLLNFQRSILTFLETIKKYPPRQKVIAQLTNEINQLQHEQQAEPKKSEKATSTTASPNKLSDAEKRALLPNKAAPEPPRLFTPKKDRPPVPNETPEAPMQRTPKEKRTTPADHEAPEPPKQGEPGKGGSTPTKTLKG